jgi:integrase
MNIARQKASIKWHPTVKGFYIRVSPKGKAVYAYKFDGPDGKTSDGTLGLVAGVMPQPIGRYRPIELDEAIRMYEDIRRVTYRTPAEVVASLDTSRNLTLRKATERWFKDHRKRGGKGKVKQETEDYYRAGLERYFSAVLDKQLADLTTEDWLTHFQAARERSKTWARGMYFMLRSVYDMFIELDVLEKNPLKKRIILDNIVDEESKPERKVEVHTLDLPKYWEAVQQRRTPSREGLEVLTLLGWRKSAVFRMRWEDLDLERCVYTIPRDNAGWKGMTGKIAFGEYARDVLVNRHARMSAKKQLDEWVWPARHGDSVPFMQDVRGSLVPISEALGYQIVQHDLRRTLVTVGEMVFPDNTALVGKLVGHRSLSAKRQVERGTQGEKEGSAQTQHYIQQRLDRDRIAATRIQEMLLACAGVLPMDEDIVARLDEYGLNPRELKLVQEPDDDEDEDAANDAALVRAA